MMPDIYTKAVLTVITIMLSVIACNQYVSPTVTAQAQGPFSGVQLISQGTGGDYLAFDSRTGDVWLYTYLDQYTHDSLHLKKTPAGYQVHYMGKLGKLGEPPTGASMNMQIE
jgi:hypothetical protein